MSTAAPQGTKPTLLMRLALRQQNRPAAGKRRSGVVIAALAATGTCLVAGVAYAYFTTTGSGTGEAQSATVTNLSITATAGTFTDRLYPGASGDVQLQIQNPNGFPVTISAVQLPANTSFAAAYSNSGLTSAIAGCTSDAGSYPSQVAWSYATGSSGSSHTLHTSLTVGANSTLTVTMTNDATMGISSPTACEGVYFQMPTLPSVTAVSSTSSASTSPATDYWSS